MSVKSVLKREGIENAKKVDTLTINKIAKRIAAKLSETFSNHNLTENDLFIELSRLPMYTADMPNDLSGAKFMFMNNSVYFKRGVEFDTIEEFATHECLHYLQQQTDARGNVLSLGLYHFSDGGNKGMAINEGAVQLMAAKANKCEPDKVKYYEISLETISPNYYPLECALLKEISYFTGEYALEHSTLYGDKIFEEAVEARFGKKSYKIIRDAFDILMRREEELNILTNELQETNEKSKAEKISKQIDKSKEGIADLFLKIQNYVIQNGFETSFKAVKNLDELQDFKNKLYGFKDLIGTTENYSFYNDYYVKTMTEFERKKEYIEQYGEIVDGNIDKPRLDIALVEEKPSIFKRILMKLGILSKPQTETEYTDSKE